MSIILTWVVVAYAQHRLPAEFVPNQSLLSFGGADRASVMAGQWWRLLTSQFLHVHLLHGILNAAVILVVGSAVERRFGVWWFVVTTAASGTVGQLVAVISSPTIVATGASQAALGTSAFALVTLARGPMRLALVPLAYVGIQIALDVLFAHYVTPPHIASFLVGMLAGGVCLLLRSA